MDRSQWTQETAPSVHRSRGEAYRAQRARRLTLQTGNARHAADAAQHAQATNERLNRNVHEFLVPRYSL